jgi:hypothetical protein
MKLLKIILEQSTVDYSDWKSGEPSDFRTNPSKYDFKYIKVGDRPIKHFKLKPTTTFSSTVDLSDYVGEYKTDTTPPLTVRTLIEGDKLFFDYSVIKEELTPSTSNDEFTLKYSDKTYTIKFTRGTDNKVNGFVAEIFGKTVKGTIVGLSSSSGTSSSSGSASTSSTASTSGSSGSSGTTTVVNKQYTKYDAITPEDRIKNFRWHDCESRDFPYEFGCKNTKIGQMNECLFGSTLKGIFSNDLWEKMTDMAFSGKKEITLEMYEAVMSSCKKQEESIKKKKIIKENTYKILNQIK